MTDDVTRSWIQTPADERAASRGCYFNAEAADYVARWVSRLRHILGRWAGEPFELLPWQWNRFVAPLFGWKKPDGLRRFRTAYLEIPKKNGKSAIASALAIYLLAGDGEPGAEVYCAAADKNQAGIVYRGASRMAQRAEFLKERIIPKDSIKHLAFEEMEAFLRVVSRDHYTSEGLNVHGLVFDELHAQKTRELWDALQYGGAAREQPLTIAITTAGDDRESICWEQHQYALGVERGEIDDDTFLPVVYGINLEKDDWTSEEAWKKANPSYGVTIDPDEMKQACERAKQSPFQKAAFLRYRLNVWVSTATPFFSMEAWDKCTGEFSEEDLERAPCYGGLDLSVTTDMSAYALFWPDLNATRVWYWCPEETVAARAGRSLVDYRGWAKDGWIETTPGEVIDYELVRERIRALHAKYNIRDSGYDRYNAENVVQNLREKDGLRFVDFPNTSFCMNEPIRHLERLILQGELRHGWNPILRWNAESAVARQNTNGDVRLDKGRSRAKIDGLVAVVMALGRSLVEGHAESVYESRGLVSV